MADRFGPLSGNSVYRYVPTVLSLLRSGLTEHARPYRCSLHRLSVHIADEPCCRAELRGCFGKKIRSCLSIRTDIAWPVPPQTPRGQVAYPSRLVASRSIEELRRLSGL